MKSEKPVEFVPRRIKVTARALKTHKTATGAVAHAIAKELNASTSFYVNGRRIVEFFTPGKVIGAHYRAAIPAEVCTRLDYAAKRMGSKERLTPFEFTIELPDCVLKGTRKRSLSVPKSTLPVESFVTMKASPRHG